MTLEPFPIEGFGGLNLEADPQEVGSGGAVDLSNVDFPPGRVRARDGWSQAQAITLTAPDGLAAFETTGGLRQFVVGYQNGATKKYQAYDSFGGSVSSATPTNTRLNATRFGTPTNEYLYIGNGVDTIWRWDGAAFTQPAGMPAGLFVAVDANSNRLVTAVTALGGSAVQWSDPGLPETWTASNFIQLAPGDGSFVEGLASWQNYVFAFKRRRFFVFTGESPDNDGLPIFNYDTVEGYGTLIPPVVGDEGVYFFDGRVVWLTTGGVPRDISRPIRRFFTGEATITADSFPTLFPAGATLSYALGKLYLSYAGLLGRRVLVYDPKVDAWSWYTTSIYYAVALRLTGSDLARVFWLDTAGVNSFVVDSHSDNGSVINWVWRSGLYSLADPGRTAVTLESSMIGANSVTLKVANDYGSLDTGSAVTLGSGATPAEGWQQIDREGRRWQHELSGTTSTGTGAAYVSSLTHFVSFVKPAGVQ